ncbi:MAG: acyltransferase family protein [Planctomycetaceae bacterium]
MPLDPSLRSPPVQIPARARLLSIDALRGFDMAWIMGLENIVRDGARAGQSRYFEFLDTQLTHVPWEGFRFYDLIYPLFIFIVGVVLPFSTSRAPGASTESAAGTRGEERTAMRRAHLRILRRVLLLFFLGLVYNDLLLGDWRNLRFAGVLQRTAICYGAAALWQLHSSWRTQFASVSAILLGYWAILAWIPAPGGVAGDLTPEGNLAGWLDRHYLPGRILPEYYGHGDNEGYLSTIPAIATALIGVLAGHWLRSGRRPGQIVLGLLAAGIGCLALGGIWSLAFPVIKNLWTSSFVLVAAGYSLGLLALFYGVVDGLGWKAWAFPWIVIGSNAIFIYVAPGVLPFEKLTRLVTDQLPGAGGPWGAFQFSVAVFLFEWLVLLIMYRKKWFLRA